MALRTTAVSLAAQRGWSLAELARRSGLSLRLVYYLRDGRSPNSATMQALRRVFPEVPFDDLFVPTQDMLCIGRRAVSGRK